MDQAASFDVRTLGLLTVLAPTLLTLAALYLHHLWPRQRSLPLWAMGSASLACAYLLTALRGTGADNLVLVVANTAGILAQCFFLVAGRLLLGLRATTWWLWPVTVGTAIFLALFTYVRPDIGIRVVAASTANLIICAAMAYVFWFRASGRLLIPGRAIAVIYALIGLAYLVRLRYSWEVGPQDSLDSVRSVVLLVPFLAGFVATVAMATLLTLAVSYEIEAELTLERERTETANRELERLAGTDDLTDLNNRGRTEALLAQAQAVADAEPGVPQLALIMLDIDGFKTVNDTFGHGVGDSVLQQVAAALSANCRPTDTVGRWGGEEFLVIAPDTSVPAAAALAASLRRAVMQVHLPDERPVTASLGVAGHQREDSTSELVSRADAALYRAKSLGRNRVEIAEDAANRFGIT